MSLVDENETNEEEMLINQIDQEMKNIHLSIQKLYNNLSLSETNDPVEKCLITNYCYSSCLLEKGISYDINDRNEDLKMFEDSLQQELDFLTSDLDRMVTKMNDYNEILSRLDRNVANLEEMMETSKKEASTTKNVNDTLKNITMRFRKEKAELKSIIFSLFSDNLDVQDLIARIIEHHFTEGSDKYLQLEDGDNVLEQIELLKRTMLFETNPHDMLQIKLADLI